MNCSIRTTIRALAAPRHRLSCPTSVWRAGLVELGRRGEGRHESGAFLLGHQHGLRRSVVEFAYYDDLDPHCLDTGIVIFDGAGYGPLWQRCNKTRLRVVADVHTHGGRRGSQSALDRDNPMVATAGHIALIVPEFAQRIAGPAQVGVYEYRGEHLWHDRSGRRAKEFFYIGRWG